MAELYKMLLLIEEGACNFFFGCFLPIYSRIYTWAVMSCLLSNLKPAVGWSELRQRERAWRDRNGGNKATQENRFLHKQLYKTLL